MCSVCGCPTDEACCPPSLTSAACAMRKARENWVNKPQCTHAWHMRCLSFHPLLRIPCHADKDLYSSLFLGHRAGPHCRTLTISWVMKGLALRESDQGTRENPGSAQLVPDHSFCMKIHYLMMVYYKISLLCTLFCSTDTGDLVLLPVLARVMAQIKGGISSIRHAERLPDCLDEPQVSSS